MGKLKRPAGRLALSGKLLLTGASSVIAALAVSFAPRPAFATESLLQSLNHSSESKDFESWRARPGMLLAQSEGDDAYDPFADYSEFEESMDEEEDINFFRNGRMLTIGFLGGYRGFTQNLGSIYSGAPSFGLYLSYFFDLRFALQVGFMTSDHVMSITGDGFDPIQGTVGITALDLNLKYYFNTQNVTRGLADLNPYVIAGFSQVYRTVMISGEDDFAKDSAFAFDAGVGIEIPMLRNKMYFGAQIMYQLITFSDEGKVIMDANDVLTGITPDGDSYTVLGILGVNF